jgi:hypothetical protein
MLPPATEQPASLSEDLATSERLSRMQGQEITPSVVITILQKANVQHVLVGAHAISAWAGDPRATIDVDLIAAKPNEARKALAAAFPDLTVEDHPVVIRFMRNKKEVIDIIKPSSAPIFQAALKHTTRTKIENLQTDVPQLEMAIALKFAAMASPTRQVEDKHQDAHDFIRMVKHNSSIDAEKLTSFAELVYAGGGPAILTLLEDIRAGRQITF